MSIKQCAVYLLVTITRLTHLQAEGVTSSTLDLGSDYRTQEAAQPESLPYVDTMMVIAVDVSGSVSRGEYETQKRGIADAFLDPSIQRLLQQCTSQGIGISYVEWSGDRSGRKVHQVVPWTHLRTANDMINFANILRASPRSSSGGTDLASALEESADLFAAAPFQSRNRIVSLSTDGMQDITTVGVPVETHLQNSRDRLARMGVAVNAIAIQEGTESNTPTVLGPAMPVLAGASGSESSIEDYLRQNVISGPQSRVTTVSDFRAYSEAFKQQLRNMLSACVS